MCGPAALPILALAAATVAATGAVVAGVQAHQQGQYEAAVATQNAKLTAQQEDATLTAQEHQRIALDRRYAATEGAQDVSLAANGVDANFGTAKRTLQDTTMFHGEDVSALDANQNAQLQNLDISAANYRSQAEGARLKGAAALTNGFFTGLSTELGGASQYGQLKAKFG